MPNDEEVFRILCKFVEEDKARDAIKKHIVLEEEFLEIIPQQWELLENELTIVPVLKRLFSDKAWMIVENGLAVLKREHQIGMLFFLDSELYAFKMFDRTLLPTSF